MPCSAASIILPQVKLKGGSLSDFKLLKKLVHPTHRGLFLTQSLPEELKEKDNAKVH